jgi:hypothetical protein
VAASKTGVPHADPNHLWITTVPLWAARRWFWYRGGRSSVAQPLARALMGVSGNDIGLRECNSWRAKPGQERRLDIEVVLLC